ncbi:MAG: cytochrome c [Chloroflexota bacterium]
MKKILIWIAGLVGLVLLFAVVMTVSTSSRMKKVYEITPEQVEIPTDEASLKEGKRLASIYCAGCHGDDFSGKEFFNDPAIGINDATNLTAGEGGVGSFYSDSDWVSALRHGVDTEGHPLFIMPSKDFYYFSDQDLGQIIAYIKSVPPLDKQSNRFLVKILGKLLIGLGVFGDVFSVEIIDHDAPRPVSPDTAVSVDYGEYLVQTFGCNTCHGPALSGGKSSEPGAPIAPNLTPGGVIEKLDSNEFIAIVQAGQSEYMPFESLKKMSTDELTAMWMYLKSLPALETTGN